MFTLKCSRCKTKIMKYRKIGKGRLLRCHKDRIIENFATINNGKLVCPKCGQVIGVDAGSFYKMKQGAFTFSGMYE